MANATVDAYLANDAQDHVLRGNSEGQRPVDPHFHGLGFELAQGLGSQHVLDLGCSDAHRERPQGAVGGGVAITANYRLARLGVAQVRAYDVYDALQGTVPVVKCHSELFAVECQCIELLAGYLVGHRQGQVPCGSVVVGGGHGKVGTAYPASRQAKAVKCLRRRHLMHQVQVDVQDRRLVRLLMHHVGVPDLLEHSFGRHFYSMSFQKSIHPDIRRQARCREDGPNASDDGVTPPTERVAYLAGPHYNITGILNSRSSRLYTEPRHRRPLRSLMHRYPLPGLRSGGADPPRADREKGEASRSLTPVIPASACGGESSSAYRHTGRLSPIS